VASQVCPDSDFSLFPLKISSRSRFFHDVGFSGLLGSPSPTVSGPFLVFERVFSLSPRST